MILTPPLPLLEHPPPLKKGKREMGPEGRPRSKVVVVAVGHCAQGPQKAAAPIRATVQVTRVQLLSSHFCAFAHAHLLRMPTVPICSNPALLSTTETLIFWPLRLKCFFPTLKFHRAYCIYYSLTLIYSCICSLFFLSIICHILSQAVSFDNYYFMFLSYFYKQTVIY